jgi:glycine dehydrogenase subunit 1
MASEESEMLEELGLKSVEELFSDIPNDIRTGPLNIEKGLPEKEVRRNVLEILGKNRTACDMPSFLGAGVYHHYIPTAVFEMISRSEFYSSYTPYQPEISQGMLQALFEYQSFVCELTGMDAANSSMYDASTSLARQEEDSHSKGDTLGEAVRAGQLRKGSQPSCGRGPIRQRNWDDRHLGPQEQAG